MEYEPGSIQDMKDAIGRLVTNGNGNGKHNRIYGYGLGGVGTAVSYMEQEPEDEGGRARSRRTSKVMHAILGPSITIPVKDNRIMMGMWQKIVLLDFGKDQEQKKVTLQIVGEFEKGELDGSKNKRDNRGEEGGEPLHNEDNRARSTRR